MGTRYASKVYQCFNDCRPSGCPGHLMRMRYQRTSDVFAIEVPDRQIVLVGDATMLETIQDLIYSIGLGCYVGDYDPTDSGVSFGPPGG